MPGAISPGVTRAVVPAHAAKKKLAAKERERGRRIDRVGVLRTTLLEIKTKKKSTERRFR
jgi:hypothetical protein